MPINANSGVTRGQAAHGARNYLAIDGSPVGYIAAFSYNKNVNEMPIDVLDDVLTAEHITGGVGYTLNLEAVHVVGRTPVDMGIEVPIAEVFNDRNRTFQIVDRPTGAVLFAFRSCKVTSVSTASRKGTVSTYNIGLVCISMADENGVIGI